MSKARRNRTSPRRDPEKDLAPVNPIESFTRELIGTVVAGAFDPRPVVFKRADETGVRPVRNGCRKSTGTLHILRGQLNRNAFLCGCQAFTHDAPTEHLIVGFGFRHGSTTVVEQLCHVVGSSGSVAIPRHVAAAISNHVLQEHDNEVILFHNHPHNPINVVLDNTPLPSGADRRTLVSFHSDLCVLGKALMGGGRVRFYVGENGFVQEFCTPDLLSLFATRVV